MSQNNGQPSSSTMAGDTASMQDEVLELNRKFYMWISSSWEMCPHFCWNGAAQEYINQINRILDGASRPGSTAHSPQEPGGWGSRSLSTPQPATQTPPSSRPPQQPAAATVQAPAPSPTSAIPSSITSPIPSASPTVPSSSGRSRKRAAQGDHPDDPNAQPAPSKPAFAFGSSTPASTSAPKPKPSLQPKPAAADKPSPPVPTPPLFSSFASTASKPASSSAPSTAAFGALATAPAFGAPASSAAPTFGVPASSSAATSQQSPAPSFSFKPTTTEPAEPKSPSFPLFSGISKSTAAGSAASSAAFGTTGGFSTAFSFGKPAAAAGGAASAAASSAAPLFSFGKPAEGGTPGAASASFSFAAAGGGGFGGAGASTPPFNFGGAPAAGAGAAGGDAAAGGDEEPEEKSEKVEIKGDDKTDITYSGKVAFRVKNESGWAGPIVGLLTLRRDKASRRCWLQVNSETKGSIFVYGSIPEGAKFRVPDGKSMMNMVINIFRYPPGQEPHKMADDGKGGKTQLPEKEDNPSSPKSVMIKVKTTDVQLVVDALKEFGCQQL